jgi:hypothetical protein
MGLSYFGQIKVMKEVATERLAREMLGRTKLISRRMLQSALARAQVSFCKSKVLTAADWIVHATRAWLSGSVLVYYPNHLFRYQNI